MESAKGNGLNPEAWLNHILSVQPDHFARNPAASIDELMSWTDIMYPQFGLQRALLSAYVMGRSRLAVLVSVHPCSPEKRGTMIWLALIAGNCALRLAIPFKTCDNA